MGTSEPLVGHSRNSQPRDWQAEAPGASSPAGSVILLVQLDAKVLLMALAALFHAAAERLFKGLPEEEKRYWHSHR